MPGKGTGRKAYLLIFLLFLSLYLSTAFGRMDSWDSELYFRLTESIVEDHRLTIAEDEFRGVTSLGQLRVGQSLFAIPLYLLAKLLGGDTRFFVSLLNPIVTAFTAVMLYVFGQAFGYPPLVAAFVTVGFGLGSLAWPYTKTFFAEPLAACGLLLTTLAIYYYRRHLERRWLLVAGCAYGVMILTRWDTMMAGPLLAIYLLWPDRSWTARVYLRLGYLLIALVPFLLAIVLYNRGQSGSYIVPYYQLIPFTPDFLLGPFATAVYGLTLSSGKGIMWYMPVAFLSLLAWPAFWRRKRLESLIFGALVLERVVAVSATTSAAWHGDVSWGPRYLVPIVPLLVLPSGFFLTSASSFLGAGGIMALVISSLSIVVQVLGVSFHHAKYHDTLISKGLVSGEQRMFDPRYSPVLVHAQWILQRETMDLLVPIYLAFPGPILISPSEIPETIRRTNLIYGGKIKLLGYEVNRDVFKPGDFLLLTLYWEAIARPEQNYITFIHVRDPVGQPAGQLQAPPAGGDHPTRRWEVGEIRRYTYRVPLERDIRWPILVNLRVGLFRQVTMQQLPVADEKGQGRLPDPIIGWVKVNSPNLVPKTPARFNLDNQVSLIGYDLGSMPEPNLQPGTQARVALYWQAQRRMGRDYVAFVHLEDSEGHLWAQSDGQPADGNYPTSLWSEGEVVKDEHVLTIPTETPPGLYLIKAGMYSFPSTHPLDMIEADGRRQYGSLLLSRVRVVRQ